MALMVKSWLVEKRRFVTAGQIRYELILAFLLTPAFALFTRALKDQHADNLIIAIFSTDNLSFHYWNTTRFGNLVAILAWPFQNPEVNLKMQILIRIFSALFVVFWIARKIAEIFSMSKVLMGFATVSVMFYFLFFYPEAGDSILYGGGAQSVGAAVLTIGLGITFLSSDKKQFLNSRLNQYAIAYIFWLFVGFLSVLWLVRAPAFILLELLSRDSTQKYLSKDAKTRFLIGHSVALISAFLTLSFIYSRGDENTTINLYGLRYYITHTWYIIDFFIVAVIMVGFIVLLGRSTKAAVIAVAVWWIELTTILMVAVDHVRQNLLDPRYFSMGHLIALSIAFPTVFAVLLKGKRMNMTVLRIKNQARIRPFMLAAFVLSLVGYFGTSVGFGLNTKDQSGFNRTAKVLEFGAYSKYAEPSEIEFITGSFWDVWPTVYQWRNSGQDVLGFVPPGTKQANFSRLLDGQEHNGICLLASKETCIQIMRDQTIPSTPILIDVSDEQFVQTGEPYSFRYVSLRRP